MCKRLTHVAWYRLTAPPLSLLCSLPRPALNTLGGLLTPCSTSDTPLAHYHSRGGPLPPSGRWSWHVCVHACARRAPCVRTAFFT